MEVKMLQDNIEYTFATDIPECDYQVILDCPFFKDWIAKARKDFSVTHVHVDSVDYFSRVHRPLFIKITATATLPDGRPVHGVVLLRGNQAKGARTTLDDLLDSLPPASGPVSP